MRFRDETAKALLSGIKPSLADFFPLRVRL